MIKNLLKKWLGITQLQAEKEALQIVRDKAVAETVLAQQREEQAKMDPKSRATERGEPYVTVLDTKINPENVRNGFFELDWNEYFIVKLRESGYTGDSEEAVVDAWFKDLCRDVAMEESVNMSQRGAGYINVNSLGNGKAEIF